MKKINLVIGTGINESGGIATVLSVFENEKFFKNQNIKLIRTHTHDHTFWGAKRFIIFLMALIKLLFCTLFYQVGVVHIHLSSRGSFTRKSVIIRMCKWMSLRTVLHLHGSEFVEFYEKESSLNKQKRIRSVFSNCDRVVVLSQSWKRWVDGIVDDPRKVVVIYNTVSRVKLIKDNVEPRSILFLGRLGKRKGVYDLISACEMIKEKVPDFKLILAGDGDIDAFRKIAKEKRVIDNIEFTGWVSGQDKLDLLARAQIYTLPSYNEGFPMGILEAMSVGMPIVGSRVGGIPEAVESGKEGLLVEAGDISGLASALISLLSNPEMSYELGMQAKKKFDENFSPEVIMPKFEELYSCVINKE
ncbi:glycosyltransferase family 4 protein [Motilimonas pumila]|uniref:Glycosyltransferase family 1 protein n=1 Tax=Motilimonas pumila TaxID=2303987 RepID=A0A418YKX4_9GAMM|nr:glycosyltransferase family 4 protein [Motilimonas pumila]RJG51632.1 glycosyltransferase family 1 protein [Motilimonas pumila]